jgi:hypothetical protein
MTSLAALLAKRLMWRAEMKKPAVHRLVLGICIVLLSPFLALIAWRGYELSLTTIATAIGTDPLAIDMMALVAALLAFLSWFMAFLAGIAVMDIEKIDPDGAQTLRQIQQTDRIVSAMNRVSSEMQEFRRLIEPRE